jgi:hypothetical protein
VPPANVGVAPTTAPEDDAMVTLCSSEAELVKAIETLPALAVSDVVSNFNWPSAFAARLSAVAAPAAAVLVAGAGVVELDALFVGAGAGAGVELDALVAGGGVVELDALVAALVGEDAEELVVVEELPQPASTSTPRSTINVETLVVWRMVAGPPACFLTGQILR